MFQFQDQAEIDQEDLEDPSNLQIDQEDLEDPSNLQIDQEDLEDPSNLQIDQEDLEDPSNLQLAWKMLELAKTLYEKHADSLEAGNSKRLELELRLSETYQILGEVSIENENYEQVINTVFMSQIYELIYYWEWRKVN